MSRIRSIHPSIYTDEAFMTASMAGRVLITALWTQAWDDGVFEWKPLTLKARIFPADAVNMQELLTELEGLGFLCRFNADDGKTYGAIRNFRKWQRPKLPNSSGVLPDEFRKYVGLSDDDVESTSPALPQHFPSTSEKSPQREDVGGRRKEEEEIDIPPVVPHSQEPAPRKASRAKPRSSIDPEARPTPEDREHARSVGMAVDDMRIEWPKFRDHHRAKGSVMADWAAAWRTWCGNWQTFRRNRPGQPQPTVKPSMTIADKATASVSGKRYVLRDTPEWDHCADRWRQQKGQYPPTDDKGGWYFPVEFLNASEAA